VPGGRAAHTGPVSWTPDDLAALDRAEELEIAAQRADGTLRAFTPIWVVCAGGQVFVRTWHRRDTGWFGAAVRSGAAQVRVPGLSADVRVHDVGPEQQAAVDEAYRVKYGRYGERTVGAMVSPDAVASTLLLTPVRPSP
jgi:hypothetical protein